MNSPLVTVLMPVYNGERHLREAIDSVLGQTLTDFEFLIIDDGSTDGSHDLIESYADPRIRLLRNGRNLGLIATLNKGLDLAQGRYIARMDCDDIALPTRLERQATFLGRHPEVGLCGSAYLWFCGETSQLVRLPEYDEAIRLTLAFQCAFGHSTVMFRRETIVAHDLKYDPAFKHAEDYELWVRCSRHMKMANLPEALMRYRFHPENISSVFRAEQKLTTARIRELQLHALELAASVDECRIHHQLAEHAFCGDVQDLAQARAWLDKFSRALASRFAMSHAEICERLSLNWYLACSILAKEGLSIWKLFMSCPVGRRAKPVFILKLLARCLIRHPITPAIAATP